MDLNKRGRFPFDRLITKMPFSKINEGIVGQHDGSAPKVVLVYQGGTPSSNVRSARFAG